MTQTELKDQVLLKLGIFTKEDIFDIATEVIPTYVSDYTLAATFTDGSKTTTLDIVNNYQIIEGLKVATDGAINIAVDSDKVAYLKLPDGTLVHSTAGAITVADVNTNAGSIQVVIPNDTKLFDLSGSDISGIPTLKLNLLNKIDLSNTNFTTEGLDVIFDIIISNGAVDGTYVIDVTHATSAPTGAKISKVENLGWNVAI